MLAVIPHRSKKNDWRSNWRHPNLHSHRSVSLHVHSSRRSSSVGRVIVVTLNCRWRDSIVDHGLFASSIHFDDSVYSTESLMQNVVGAFRDTIVENNRHAYWIAKHWPSVLEHRPFSERHPVMRWHSSCLHSSPTRMNAWTACFYRSRYFPRCEPNWKYVHLSLWNQCSPELVGRSMDDRGDYWVFHWNNSGGMMMTTREVRDEDESIDVHHHWNDCDGEWPRRTQKSHDVQEGLVRLNHWPDGYVFVLRVVVNRSESLWNYYTAVLCRLGPWWDRELRLVLPYFLHNIFELPLLSQSCRLSCWKVDNPTFYTCCRWKRNTWLIFSVSVIDHIVGNQTLVSTQIFFLFPFAIRHAAREMTNRHTEMIAHLFAMTHAKETVTRLEDTRSSRTVGSIFTSARHCRCRYIMILTCASMYMLRRHLLELFANQAKVEQPPENDEPAGIEAASIRRRLIAEQTPTAIRDFSSQYGSNRSYSYVVSNICCKPEIYPSYGDSTHALVFRTYGPWWLSLPSYYESNKHFTRWEYHFTSKDFIDIEFQDLVYQCVSLNIYETYNPGTLNVVYVGEEDEQGNCTWHRVWTFPQPFSIVLSNDQEFSIENGLWSSRDASF